MTDDEVDEKNAEIDKRTKLKKVMLNIGTIFGIVAIISEMFLRLIYEYQYPLIIFNSQLIAIGIILLSETLYFQRISRRIFEGDFKKEQYFFKISLWMFLGTYALRILNILIITILFDTYASLYMDGPILFTSL